MFLEVTDVKRIVALFMVLLLIVCCCSCKKEPVKQQPQIKQTPTQIATVDQTSPATQPPTVAPTQAPTEKPTTDPTLKRELDTIISNNNYEGVISIYYQGKNVYQSATGYADKYANRKNTVNDVFRVASITKQFTSTAICMLNEQGKLSLSDPVSKYFDGAVFGDSVTIENLLNMTSGVPDFAYSRYGSSSLFGISEQNSAQTNKDILESWILSCNLLFTPGTMWDYSNSNYFLLGRIIEKVSGQTYENFINSNIILKLNMNNTSFDVSNVTTNGYVSNSTQSEYDFMCMSGTQWLLYPGVMFASGDMCSSVGDLYKWIRALRNGEIVSIQTLATMIQNNGFSYGYGFMTNDVTSYHTGNVGSYNTYLGFNRYKDFVVIVLSNTYSYSVSNESISVLLSNTAFEYLK